MSRVFVSCSYRDRAVGAELGSLVRALGHEPADDHDDSQGTAWWNEVVGRIEASDVFVAVASPSYADAHACRLAAKHAAATGIPVVRVDLDERAARDCHPVVAAAVGLPFAPEDPETVARLAAALDPSPAHEPRDPGEGRDTVEAPDPDDPDPARPTPDTPDVRGTDEAAPPNEPTARDGLPARFSGSEIGAAVVMVLSALGLLYVGLTVLTHSEPATPGTSNAGPELSEIAPPGNGAPAEAVAALLAAVGSVSIPGLPASACQAGADAVTCTRPSPNISTVVLTPFETPSELYEAYTAAVEERSGQPIPENTGNCSTSEAEGEVGWNLDKKHTLDFSVAEQETGGLDPASGSAGRVFCTDSQQVMSMVWTQDPGLLVTVTGQPSELVVTWWSDVHLQLACANRQVGSGCAA